MTFLLFCAIIITTITTDKARQNPTHRTQKTSNTEYIHLVY